jgi:hypothetical protein
MDDRQKTPQDTTPWDRTQMETDDGQPNPDEPTESAPKWNKASMGEERTDHTRTPRATEEELADSGGPLSGGGENPGGGERWADRDKA